MTSLLLIYLALACVFGCISLLASPPTKPWLSLLAHALWPISLTLVLLWAQWNVRSKRWRKGQQPVLILRQRLPLGQGHYYIDPIIFGNCVVLRVRGAAVGVPSSTIGEGDCQFGLS